MRRPWRITLLSGGVPIRMCWRGWRTRWKGTADFPLMRRFRNLYSYARLLHSLSEKPEPEPEWMLRLVKRLEMRRDELERSILLR